jgi:hypothetical protein
LGCGSVFWDFFDFLLKYVTLDGFNQFTMFPSIKKARFSQNSIKMVFGIFLCIAGITGTSALYQDS